MIDYEDVTVKQFKKAWFKGDRSFLNDEDFKNVYTQYVDTSGLYESEEFNKVSYIYLLNNRINTVTLFVKLQKEFIEEFDIPFLPSFAFIKESLGIVFEWRENKQRFIKDLEKALKKENKYKTVIDEEESELLEMRRLKNRKEFTLKETEASFNKMIYSLRKQGNPIHLEETNVQELAVIIKEEKDK